MLQEHSERLVREADLPAAQLLRDDLQPPTGNDRDIFATLAQRWEVDPQDVEPVVQVLPEVV